ncbi:MAG: histidine kinase [Bacteroidota bacterium]
MSHRTFNFCRRRFGSLGKCFLVIFMLIGGGLSTVHANQIVDSLLVKLEQAETDSARTVHSIDLANIFVDINPDSARLFAIRAQKLAREVNNVPQQVKALVVRGEVAQIFGQEKEARRHLEHADSLAEITGDFRLRSVVALTLAGFYYYLGDAENNLRQVERGLDLALSSADTSMILQAYSNLGAALASRGRNLPAIEAFQKASGIADRHRPEFDRFATSIHYNTGVVLVLSRNWEEALRELKLALDLAEELRQQILIGEIRLAIGAVYAKTDQMDRAEEEYLAALEVAEEIQSTYNLHNIHDGLGILYRDQNRLEQARFHNQEELRYARKLGNDILVSLSESSLALTESRLGHRTEANRLITSARKIYEENTIRFDSTTLKNLFLNFAGTYHELGRDDLAYPYMKEHNAIYNKKTEAENLKQVNELREQYKSQLREKEIARLEVVQAKKDLELAVSDAQLNRSYWIIALVGAIGLLVALVVFFVLRQRELRTQREKLDLQQRLLRSQINPHFIFNCLNSVQRLYIDGELDLANDYIADFGHLLRQILEESGRDRISIRQELETLELYLRLEQTRLKDKFDYTIAVDPELDQHYYKMPPLILQPIVENAIWHGILPQKTFGNIRVAITTETGKLNCTVQDDGIGYENSRAHRPEKPASMGMKIIRERLGNPEGLEIRQLRHPDGSVAGTEVRMELPLLSQ